MAIVIKNACSIVSSAFRGRSRPVHWINAMPSAARIDATHIDHPSGWSLMMDNRTAGYWLSSFVASMS